VSVGLDRQGARLLESRRTLRVRVTIAQGSRVLVNRWFKLRYERRQSASAGTGDDPDGAAGL
jgi:hypothetical protein